MARLFQESACPFFMRLATTKVFHPAGYIPVPLDEQKLSERKKGRPHVETAPSRHPLPVPPAGFGSSAKKPDAHTWPNGLGSFRPKLSP